MTASGPTELGSMFNALAATAARSTPISEEEVAMVTSSQTKCFSSAPREKMREYWKMDRVLSCVGFTARSARLS